MNRRLTYFVDEVNQTDNGWLIVGEPGLGPPEPGDEFYGLVHQDDDAEEAATFRVMADEGGWMSIMGPHSVRFRVRRSARTRRAPPG